MGKKGKKSRRQQAKKVDTDNVIFDNVSSRICGLLDLTNASAVKELYSDCATNLRVGIEFIKTKQKVLCKLEYGPNHLCKCVLELYRYLIWLEDRRYNYQAVVEVYNDLKDNFLFEDQKIGKDWLEDDDMDQSTADIQQIQVLYEFALVATKNGNSDTSCICKFLYQQLRALPVDATLNYVNGVELLGMTENVLRAAKKFDEVIDLDKKLLFLPNLPERLKAKVSLAVSYVERYREEYHLRSKKEDYILINNFLYHIRDNYTFNNIRNPSFKLALAQWHYLCHKLSDEKHKQLCYELSISNIEKIVENEWTFKDYCSTCTQAPTKDDVKYVCSGCRVSCYCSIDHQRVNWRKNQVRGTCVGHETFCPVLKAYRKWKAAAKENKERMRRRFERECLDFLAYGLRLEKKCFELEDILAE
ncbi:predicted protein [Chaetoceros tenuissimus]|uniref:MYND-type domain-containing protein n=1 Tax=Chaetoceros tenuissimus TaxID=426638 RepID=A0AAD3H7U9_9STRA|nr:predicted protein [Chaetoceros tenuissimus]